MKYDVFISYSSKDQKVAEGICGYLESHGIRCFVAYRDIPKAKVWAAAIVEGLDESKMMVVVFSQNFNLSDQVDREIELASEDKKPRLTYRISNDAFQGAKKYYLKNLNWIDAFPDPKVEFGNLLNNICRLIGKPVALDYSLSDNLYEKPDSKRKAQEDEKRKQIRTFNVNGVTFDMIRVEGGTFTMGATSEQGSDAYGSEKPAHQVTLSSYYIGKYEVTQALWQAVTGSTPSYFKGDNLPVENVSWNDCQTFIRELNLKTGKTFRLPTEAEWEYACRGGNKSQGYKYSGSNNINDVAWYYNNSKPHEVGKKFPNELGLYDMSGNVWEWCQDWFGSYSSSPQTNPTGPESGYGRVGRGGSWDINARDCRSSSRDGSSPGYCYDYLGLRLVLSE